MFAWQQGNNVCKKILKLCIIYYQDFENSITVFLTVTLKGHWTNTWSLPMSFWIGCLTLFKQWAMDAGMWPRCKILIIMIVFLHNAEPEQPTIHRVKCGHFNINERCSVKCSTARCGCGSGVCPTVGCNKWKTQTAALNRWRRGWNFLWSGYVNSKCAFAQL